MAALSFSPRSTGLYLVAAAVLLSTACHERTLTAPVQVQTSVPVTDTLTCDSTTQTSMALGEVRTSLPGVGICLTSSAVSEYALVGFHTSTSPAAEAQVVITSHGVTSPAQVTFNGAFIPTLGTMTPPHPGLRDVSDEFDWALRERERQVLTPLIPAAERTMASGQALETSIPASVTVGQIISLNANGTDPCANPNYRGGRVAAISSTAIVVADTGNPAGGFTDSDYASFGATFDTLINPLDVNAFGQPTDIDKNGKIVIFFTGQVNKLTPPGSGTFIGGFFFSRDLFPQTTTGNLSGCAGSNVGEMFYVLVPDPSGSLGNVFQKNFVDSLTTGTLAHEYQHLINAGHHLYINHTGTTEETWLNEGMSHIAEELLFYHVSGLTPRQNITAATLLRTQAIYNSFTNYQYNNIDRFGSFLAEPSTHSPYAANDSLPTRGSAWSFLRYAADQTASSDGTIWAQLVNGTQTGLANLTNVFGSNLPTLFDDWSVSIFADDIAAPIPAAFTQPSWNLRSVFSHALEEAFPLETTSLITGTQSVVTIDGGGSGYWRFQVPAGARASVIWAALPAVSFSIVRTR